MVQRRQAGPRSAADDHPRRRAERRAEENDDGPRAAAAAVSRLADAARTSSRATPRSTWWPTCWPAARTRGCTSGWSTTCRSRRDVTASQQSQALSSYFLIVATPRPGHTVDELQKVDRRGDREAAARGADRRTSCERSLNQIESSFYNRMERVGGFGGKADQLNAYYTDTGDPDWFNEDLARYRALSAVRHPRRGAAVTCRSTAASS